MSIVVCVVFVCLVVIVSVSGVVFVNKQEHIIRGLKVMLLEGDKVDTPKHYLLSAIENYANLNERIAKVVFFNYDDEGNEEGVTFFFRKDF